jgi:alpha-ribazole phosphatase
MQLWLARHAVPLIESGICYGAMDVASDAHETLKAAQRLASELPQALAVYYSPQQRCAALARALHDLRQDLVLQADPRLREMDFGAWEGQHWEAIDRGAFDAWTRDFAHHRPGGGESVGEFIARVAAAWDETVAGGRSAAWITHAGVIRAAGLLNSGIRAVSRADEWPRPAPPFGDWIVLRPPTS